MNRLPPRSPGVLRIWQQNVRKSHEAQQYVINTADPKDWDVIALQEPCLDFFKNTRASSYWRVIYPPTHRADNAARTRSVLLINTNIATDAYVTLPVPSADISAVRFIGNSGSLALFNIYNDCTHNDSLTSLSSYLSSAIRLVKPSPDDHMFWLGDFNRHHPLWESVSNRHLNSSEDLIEPLLTLLRDYDMDLSLPPEIPTLFTSGGRWTRPDNVWHSHHDHNPIISCNTVSEICPPVTDHLPVITVAELPVPRSPTSPVPNFHDVDWEEFNKALKDDLSRNSPALHISSEAEFTSKVDLLTTIIQRTIASQVPMRKPCPFSKRWWNREIADLVDKKNKLSNEMSKFCDITNHPSIAAHRKISNKLTETIKASKDAHWVDWLENANAREIYTANKYVTNEPSDLSCARIPDLNTTVNGAPAVASTNNAKAQALAESFFPPPPSVFCTPKL